MTRQITVVFSQRTLHPCPKSKTAQQVPDWQWLVCGNTTQRMASSRHPRHPQDASGPDSGCRWCSPCTLPAFLLGHRRRPTAHSAADSLQDRRDHRFFMEELGCLALKTHSGSAGRFVEISWERTLMGAGTLARTLSIDPCDLV